MPGSDLLGKQILIAMSEKKFQGAFASKVGDYSQEQVSRSERIGERTFHFLVGGLVAVEDSIGRWSLYETAEITAYNAHITAWADFSRGSWTARVPDRPGVYPTRDRLGARGLDRTLVLLAEGQGLRDITKGFVGLGKVTEWVGEWWSHPYPPLPGAKRETVR